MNKEKFKEQLMKLLSVKELNDHTPISKKDGSIDSMSATEILFLIETELDIEISWNELDSISNYGELKKLIGIQL